ncbi:MAG: hypothetical protein IKH78_06250 [Ruminococcus sp.]|nr:hypothetical protein [Ruminococcus sp.]
MKKLISSIIACSLALCTLVSCGSSQNSNSSSGSSKAAKKADNSSQLIGTWALSGVGGNGVDSGGLIFNTNGKGSIYQDTSTSFHFEEDGLVLGSNLVPNDKIKKEGNIVTVGTDAQTIIKMTKLTDTAGNDGTYSLDGGSLFDTISNGIKEKGNLGDKNIDISIRFDGQNSEVIFQDLFSYATKGDNITLSGFTGLSSSGGDKVDAEYSINGDTLVIKEGNASETLTRVK